MGVASIFFNYLVPEVVKLTSKNSYHTIHLRLPIPPE